MDAIDPSKTPFVSANLVTTNLKKKISLFAVSLSKFTEKEAQDNKKPQISE